MSRLAAAALLVLFAAAHAAAGVAGCGCYCGVVIAPPCGDQRCLRACGGEAPAPERAAERAPLPQRRRRETPRRRPAPEPKGEPAGKQAVRELKGADAVRPSARAYAAQRRTVECALAAFTARLAKMGPEPSAFAKSLRSEAAEALAAVRNTAPPADAAVEAASLDRSWQSTAQGGGQAVASLLFTLRRDGSLRLSVLYQVDGAGPTLEGQTTASVDADGVVRGEMPADVESCVGAAR